MMTIDQSMPSAPSSMNRDDFLSALEAMRRHLELTDALSEHGEEREVRWSETEKRFCSDECRLEWFRAAFKADNSPHWRGGAISYYGPSWRAARRAVRQRDGYRCQSCGTAEKDLPERLSVAHIISFREFGLERHEEANRLDNLICLCRSCHLAFDHLTGVR